MVGSYGLRGRRLLINFSAIAFLRRGSGYNTRETAARNDALSLLPQKRLSLVRGHEGLGSLARRER
jgi:hypothetical protein